MMATVTKAGVLKLAQKKYGKNAIVEHNPKALDAAGKEVNRQKRKAMSDRIKELEAEKKALLAAGDPRTALREAARFAVDVDGDEPSWTKLREALEREEKYAALTQEIRELGETLRKMTHGLRYRWEVGVIDSTVFPVCLHREGADTLEELAAKLESRS